MKNKILIPVFTFLFLLFLVACSTRKNTFVSRNFHALTTRDNILYNGNLALNKGVEDINNEKDNFWNLLPIEKMLIVDENSNDDKVKNTDLETAEAKAAKAVQMHSMNIDGQEKNHQMDEAFLLLGKARYYQQRFFPALEAFNYILYKYPSSDKIKTAKIWREKTNMRLGNDVQVLKNMTKLLKEKNLKPQIIADANATLAESYLNLEQKDSVIGYLKKAHLNTNINTEKARYGFILGQLYQELGIRDSALVYFDKVIKMNRKAERDFLIPAQIKKVQLFDYENGNHEEFVKFLKKLIKERENRPYKDVLNYEMAVFYDKKDNQKLAYEYYNTSLKTNSNDSYLIASNYRNLGNMYFRNTDYFIAAKYYDSTLTKMEPKTREYIHYKKIRKDLDEVIEYEIVAKANDSILKIVSMSKTDQILYYQNYIDNLKKEEEKKIIEAKKLEEINKTKEKNTRNSFEDPDPLPQQAKSNRPLTAVAPPPISKMNQTSTINGFYFYNPSVVAYGKIEFKKKFGNRALQGNWKTQNTNNEVVNDTLEDKPIEKSKLKPELVEKPEYSTAFYIDKLPTSKSKLDSINKERNFAYYKLGVVYKEKLKEYKLATEKLEKLLLQNPEEKLVLPSFYNLYKIYEITNPSKSDELKNKILSQYPNSRYAQIINNINETTKTESELIDLEYIEYYKLYQNEQYTLILEKIDALIDQYFGYEIVSKYELLKANVLGKTSGLEPYKKSISHVADNYPKTEEGKTAREILTIQIPLLEQLKFNTNESNNWKVLCLLENNQESKNKTIESTIKTFVESEKEAGLSYTIDSYTHKQNFIVIQGANTEAYADFIADNLNNNKRYKIGLPLIIISNENYKIIQIKKNVSEFQEFIKNSKTSKISNDLNKYSDTNHSNDTNNKKQDSPTTENKKTNGKIESNGTTKN